MAEIKKLNEFKTVFDNQLSSFGKLNNDFIKCQDDNRGIQGQVSSLNLQVSQIPNYQSQIERLQK